MCPWTLSAPRSSQFSESVAGGKLFTSRNRLCQQTDIVAYFRAKWRLGLYIIQFLNANVLRMIFEGQQTLQPPFSVKIFELDLFFKALSKLFPCQNRYCPLTKMRAYFVANGGYSILNKHFIQFFVLLGHGTTTLLCLVLIVSSWHCSHVK